jgi:hypothetical protein
MIIGTLALLIFDRNLIPMPFPVITRILSISVSQTCIGYSTIETKEAAHIGYNGFLFPHEYSGEGRGA